jgi:hypothetical protein
MAVAEKGRRSGCPPTAHSLAFAIIRKPAYKANTHIVFYSFASVAIRQ